MWPRKGFPGGASGKEPTCQCRRCESRGFNPWVGKIPWRRAWQPHPIFLPGEFHGQRNLVDYSPWSYKELDTTEVTYTHMHMATQSDAQNLKREPGSGARHQLCHLQTLQGVEGAGLA